MKASNKNRLQKIEATQNTTKKPIGEVIIYDPENPRLDEYSRKTEHIIALSDNKRGD